MNPMWLAFSYLIDRARARARAAMAGNPESGALSLEWVVIAVLVAGAATAASLLIRSAIASEAGSLP
ncbi:MAG: hypothetical protein ABSB01_02995 [Streptosporangiaceae bacterium]